MYIYPVKVYDLEVYNWKMIFVISKKRKPKMLITDIFICLILGNE